MWIFVLWIKVNSIFLFVNKIKKIRRKICCLTNKCWEVYPLNVWSFQVHSDFLIQQRLTSHSKQISIESLHLIFFPHFPTLYVMFIKYLQFYSLADFRLEQTMSWLKMKCDENGLTLVVSPVVYVNMIDANYTTQINSPFSCIMAVITQRTLTPTSTVSV